MPLNYDLIMGLSEVRHVSYSERDTMLYALGVGFGRDPVSSSELPFVFEGAGLKAAPTMVCIIAGGMDIVLKSGVDVTMMVHGEQRSSFLRPLPVAGDVTATSKVKALIDKGAGKGAVLVIETTLTDSTGNELGRTSSTAFCRGDGGFGGPTDGAPPVHAIPDSAADLVVETYTRADQALLYRLSGDYNPLHADPSLARKVGFDSPILHGLCTYGSVGRQILTHCCDFEVARLRTLDVRFSNPVYPGETLVTEIWGKGSERSFRTTVKERGLIVLNNGKAEIL